MKDIALFLLFPLIFLSCCVLAMLLPQFLEPTIMWLCFLVGWHINAKTIPTWSLKECARRGEAKRNKKWNFKQFD
jgi:hypothetical protein